MTSRSLNRRGFLTTAAASTVGLVAVGARPAAAATGITVYRLNADWGYPVGPKGKTKCACRSCYRRAASGFFRTEAAAIAGRVHPCCVCQTYTTMLTDVSGDDLFQGGDTADLRDPRVAAVLSRTSAVGSTVPSAAIPASTGSAGLPRTGGSSRQLTGVGAALVAVGGALVALRHRGSELRSSLSPIPVTDPVPPASSKEAP